MAAPSEPSGWVSEHEHQRMMSRRGRRHAYEHLEPATTALVVIDMVPFFAADDAGFDEVAGAIDDLADHLRARGGAVAWVVPAFGPATAHATEFYGPATAAAYAASGGTGDPRERLWPGFTAADGDIITEKTAPSAFFPGRCDLHDQLRARGVDAVLIAGAVTNVCCESSARDAATLGYRVVMVSDLNLGGNEAARRATFTVVYRSFGDVRTSAEVRDVLR